MRITQHLTENSEGFRTVGVSFSRYVYGSPFSYTECYRAYAIVFECWFWRYQLTFKTQQACDSFGFKR